MRHPPVNLGIEGTESRSTPSSKIETWKQLEFLTATRRRWEREERHDDDVSVEDLPPLES